MADYPRLAGVVNDVLDQFSQPDHRVPLASEIIAGLIDRDGGIQGFIQKWYDQLEIARAKNPGAKFVLDHHRHLIQLLAQVNQTAADAIDVQSMDEEETRNYITSVVLGQMRRHPKLLEALETELHAVLEHNPAVSD